MIPRGSGPRGGAPVLPQGSPPRPVQTQLFLLRPSIESQFLAFHEANPHVLRLLEGMCAELLAAGRDRVGMKMLWEVLRWKVLLRVKEAEELDPYKLNNNFTSRYARLLLDRNPALRGVLEIRELRSP